MDAARPKQKQAGERGKLTIFFSFYSGTGKSYAMLREASRVRQEGTDVAVGLLSCDAWPETAVLAESFEELPCKIVRQDGKDVREIDLDACLERKPHLLLVDDLSHRNADCTRHVRRYQDISELLKARGSTSLPRWMSGMWKAFRTRFPRSWGTLPRNASRTGSLTAQPGWSLSI